MPIRCVAVVLAFAAFGACAPVGPPPGVAAQTGSPAVAAAGSTRPDRVAGWRADLAALVPGMARLHPALEHSVTRAELDSAVAALSANVPALSDDQLLVGLMRVVALVSLRGCDAHTGLYVWGEGTYPVDSLPLRVWLFDEGVFIVDALPPYRDLIGARIDSLAGWPMPQVLAAIDPLVPRDNDVTVRLLTPRFLLVPQVLRGLGIAGTGSISLAVTAPSGQARSVAIDPVPMRAYNAWAGAYGLHLPSDASVLYLSRSEEPLWWTDVDGDVLYIQYNRVDYLSQSTLDGLRSALGGTRALKIVVDIRHNYGGEKSAFVPVLAALGDAAAARPGRLFVVTGRNTFSAASMFLAELAGMTNAVVVGESMGGCPNPIGNARPVTLAFSGIVVEVGTVQEAAVSSEDRRLTIPPTLAARLTPTAWMAKQDPALAAIRAFHE